MVMDDELLSDILAAERAIRLEIDAHEAQVAEELERLQQDLDQELVNISRTLQEELAGSLHRAEGEAEREAMVLLDSARAFAQRLENLDTPALNEVVGRHLGHILPKGTA